MTRAEYNALRATYDATMPISAEEEIEAAIMEAEMAARAGDPSKLQLALAAKADRDTVSPAIEAPLEPK